MVGAAGRSSAVSAGPGRTSGIASVARAAGVGAGPAAAVICAAGTASATAAGGVAAAVASAKAVAGVALGLGLAEAAATGVNAASKPANAAPAGWAVPVAAWVGVLEMSWTGLVIAAQ